MSHHPPPGPGDQPGVPPNPQDPGGYHQARSGPGGPHGPHGPAGPPHPHPQPPGGPAGYPNPTAPMPAAAPAQYGQQYAPAPPQPERRPRRGIPAWMVLSGMLVVALIAGGAGGLAGNYLNLGEDSAATADEEEPSINEPPPEAPERDPDTIAGVAQRVSPSVVSILSAGSRVQGGGSGFVIEGDYVVTNDHVSAALEEDGIVVEFSDGNTSEASVVGADPGSDLSVLALEEPQDVEALEFSDSDEAIVGDEVIAIGAPLGLAGTVTQGIISAVDRPVSPDETEAVNQFYAIQTDAAINPGNSGGPLVDVQGGVIGVNSMIITMGGFMDEPSGNIGLGFAIPANEAENVVEGLIEDGGTGSEYADIGAVLDLESPIAGAVVSDEDDALESGGPADEAGLEAGDVIVSLEGRRVNSGQELLAMLRDYEPGDEVEIEYERAGSRDSVELTLVSSDD